MKLLQRLLEDREKPGYVDDNDDLLNDLDHKWWKMNDEEIDRIDFECDCLNKIEKFFEWSRK